MTDNNNNNKGVQRSEQSSQHKKRKRQTVLLLLLQNMKYEEANFGLQSIHVIQALIQDYNENQDRILSEGTQECLEVKNTVKEMFQRFLIFL